MKKRTLVKALCNLDLLLATIALTALVLITSCAVFMRYVLKAPLLWQEEAQAFCQVWMVFLGGSVAFRAGSVVAIEMVVDALSPKARRIVEYFIDGFILLVLLYLAIQSRAYLVQVFERSGRSTSILRIPYTVLYGVAPYGCVLMIISYLINRYLPWFVKETEIEFIDDVDLLEKEEGEK